MERHGRDAVGGGKVWCTRALSLDTFVVRSQFPISNLPQDTKWNFRPTILVSWVVTLSQHLWGPKLR